MRESQTDFMKGAEAGRGLGEMMSGPAAVRNDPTGPDRRAGRAVLKGMLSLSLSLSTYRRLELCLVEM